MGTTVGDFLLQRLSEWGVRRIYSYPGDGIMGAFGRAGERMKFVLARHEPGAAAHQLRPGEGLPVGAHQA